MTSIVRDAWAIVKGHWKVYLATNVVYYGLVIAGMVYVSTDPSVQQTLLESIGVAFSSGLLSFVGTAYTSGQVIWASAVTFLVNLFVGSLAEITLPSMIVPFVGLLMGILRAVLWGLALAPTSPRMAKIMIPHSLTLVLEGQAYILVLLAMFVQGKSFLWPRSEGTESHLQGYKIGLVKTAKIYILVILVLLLAAIYEALEVIYLVPLFTR